MLADRSSWTRRGPTQRSNERSRRFVASSNRSGRGTPSRDHSNGRPSTFDDCDPCPTTRPNRPARSGWPMPYVGSSSATVRCALPGLRYGTPAVVSAFASPVLDIDRRPPSDDTARNVIGHKVPTGRPTSPANGPGRRAARPAGQRARPSGAVRLSRQARPTGRADKPPVRPSRQAARQAQNRIHRLISIGRRRIGGRRGGDDRKLSVDMP